MDRIITIKQAEELDKKSGIAFIELMENAGRAVFEEIKTRYKKCKVVVLCGIGNNGGDGYVIARYLQKAKYDVTVFLNDLPASKDAKIMYEKWNEIGGKSFNFKYVERENFAGVDLIIDAMFGSGLNRDIQGEYRRIVELVNSPNIPIVSVDLPTGINGDTGKIMGACIKANLTVTFTLPKIAHIITPSNEYCGELKIVDIGIPQSAVDELNIRTFINSPVLWKEQLPKIKTDDNKYTRGLLLINSGEMYGATILASKAAKKVGAGIVYIACDNNNYNLLASHTISDVLKKTNTIGDFEDLVKDKKLKFILLGSGNGRTEFLKEKIFTALKYTNKILFDADAISLFEDDEKGKELLFSSIKSNCIFTPHLGEFKRMFNYNENDKIGSVIEAARKSKSVVMLKGHDTIIASPSGEVVISTHSSPYLSIAGAGDVLSGIISGLVAQGMEEFKAVCCAAWIHGDASLRLNKIFTIKELIDSLSLEIE